MRTQRVCSGAVLYGYGGACRKCTYKNFTYKYLDFIHRVRENSGQKALSIWFGENLFAREL